MTTVLIIDDHPIVLQGCRRMLTDIGIADVIEAGDATSGYRLFSDKRPDVVIVARALQAGATGYVVKDTSSENFIEAFKKVRVGMRYLSDDLAMQVAFANAPGRENPLAELTPRELQTLALLAEGKPYNRIAADLNLSYKTVVNISSQLKQKLNAENLPELIRIAVKMLSAAP